MMTLTVKPAAPILKPKPDGTGYTLLTPRIGHDVNLQIGNVSVAFDGRNHWRSPKAYSGVMMEFSEYPDCPVRLGDEDCPDCDNVAETLLFALAADLGYTVSK